MFIWSIRTIYVFSEILTLTCKFPSITTFFGTKHFFKLSGKWIDFVEVSFQKGSLLKSSWLSLPLGLRRLFFQKLSFLDFLDMPIFEKCVFPYILWLFQKWLPRPNHYAHDVRSEILCRTPVSILKYLSTWAQNLRRHLIIVAWPQCRPEFPSDGGDDGVPTTLPSGLSPVP